MGGCCEDDCCGDECCGNGKGRKGKGLFSGGLFGSRSGGKACGNDPCNCNPGMCGVVGGLASGFCPHGGGYPEYPTYNPGPPTGQVAYPYYTVRGPRDFLMSNPPSIGPY